MPSWVPACGPTRPLIYLPDRPAALADRSSVLVTRPLPGATETARGVAALGLYPVLAPLLEVQTLPAELPADAAAVLVTSRNAIGSLPDWARDRPVFAVGDATAARVRSAGFQDVRSASGDAAALVELVCRMMPQSAPLLLLTGKGQGEALAGRLRGRFPAGEPPRSL